MNLSSRHPAVILSPLLIILVNFGIAVLFRQSMGKWVFIPMILVGWMLWIFFIVYFGKKSSIQRWLQKPKGGIKWGLLAVLFGLIPIPLFIFHSDTLSTWQIWLPWILLALLNPWIEEFYWRGLILDSTAHWNKWIAAFYSSSLFAVNHIAFGLSSDLNKGPEVVISTFLMGLIWALVYFKTKSLRWAILAHFLVDFFGLSAPAFLDLWEKGTW